MQNHLRNARIETLIIELCTDDYFGSWELWWAISRDPEARRGEQLALEFVKTVSLLIESGKLACYSPGPGDKQFVRAAFSRERLMSEIAQAESPDPNSSYWFWSA
jgi:hypothetical protein